MTRDESRIKDWRSTGRRKARRELYKARVPYRCAGYPGHECGVTSIEPPKDAPSWFHEIWPEELRVLDYQLQADHESKDVTNNEIDFLNWACAPCHKHKDSQTGKGEAQTNVNYW